MNIRQLPLDVLKLIMVYLRCSTPRISKSLRLSSKFLKDIFDSVARYSSIIFPHVDNVQLPTISATTFSISGYMSDNDWSRISRFLTENLKESKSFTVVTKNFWLYVDTYILIILTKNNSGDAIEVIKKLAVIYEFKLVITTELISRSIWNNILPEEEAESYNLSEAPAPPAYIRDLFRASEITLLRRSNNLYSPYLLRGFWSKSMIKQPFTEDYHIRTSNGKAIACNRHKMGS